MNENAVLCRFIRDNSEDYEEKLGELSIRIHRDGALAIFNYGLLADFTNPYVRQARGIIIRMDTLDVVCWPFDKFCNAQEEAARVDLENFDWAHCHCQEKIDGSIVKLFFNPFTDQWQWATNACIDAGTATVASCIDQSYLDVIKKADNFRQIPFASLDKSCTYIFELVSPQTQVIVRYPAEHLYHTGTRNNLTGQEMDTDIGIEKPKEYPLSTLEECLQAADALNPDEDSVTQEGFVVVDRNWHRIKVKSPAYFAMHRMVKNNNFSKEKIIRLLREGQIGAEQLAADFPLYAVYFRYYAYKMTELEWNVSRFISYARAVYAEYDYERKPTAMKIKDSRYAFFGFEALKKNDRTAREMLDDIPLEKYCRMIPDYVPEKLY